MSSSKAKPQQPQSRSPSRFASALKPPALPQQEISEKVRDAFEDLELGGISLSQRVYAAQQQSELNRARSRSRSRGRSRGRSMERTNRDMRDEWDEKRRLSMKYATASPVPGPSNACQALSPHQTRPGPIPIQGPIRSSSLTSASFSHPPQTLSSQASTVPPPPYSSLPSFSTASLPSYTYNYSSYSSSVRRMLLAERLRPWIPVLLYAATTLGFVLAIAFWKEEVFSNLDDLARWLRAEGETGYAVMFFLIFLTCIPPFPLYSTLQVLSGYTFGAWTGAVVSYFSALAGAVFVFWISRSLPSLRSAITSCMSRSNALQRVVRAISRRPSLLFLVRLAPYPYNVLNALLAGCPRLTFRTYTVCTALSLLKVIIHTSIGAGIKSFAEYHIPAKSGVSVDDDGKSDEDDASFLSHTSSIAGIVLCIALAIYLSYVARRAIDEELEDDDDLECNRGRSRPRARRDYDVRADDEERAAFLDGSGGVGLGADFAIVSNAASGLASVRGRDNSEMVERDGAVQLGATAPSPVPMSSLSADPYGPPEWVH
ncbi:hypothetical protein DFH11DRAFT_1689520 [Phellopilus nigrolimitatus]|nr:hypothetical protein DFH11DRAFT_1689520 [Phellopilus nigrolimitatus]